MILEFWNNPEFIRHRRADLRPGRMLTAAGVSLFLCMLLGRLVALQTGGIRAYQTASATDGARAFFTYIVIAQACVLSFWCLASCSSAIAGERLLKTFDFLRTTRLTAGELLIGLLSGAPVTAYFAVGCTLPVSLAAGLAAGLSVSALLLTYAVLLVFVIFLSLCGLLTSMVLERPRFGLFVNLIVLWLVAATGSATGYSGLVALSIVPGLLPFYDPASRAGTPYVRVFGAPVSTVVVSLLLYASAGAWIALVLVRNLKREREDIRPLSRKHALGLAAYFNFLILAFMDSRPVTTASYLRSYQTTANSLSALIAFVTVNRFLLFVVGLGTLVPAERLKMWARRRSLGKDRYISENGPGWPWILASALVAYGFLVTASVSTTPRELNGGLLRGALALAAVSVYIVRDTVFLQWCMLTRMKRPIIGGLLYLSLYYFTVALLFRNAGLIGLWSLAPGAAAAGSSWSWPAFLGPLIVQVFIIGFLLYAIDERLRRPATIPVPASAA